MMTNKILPSEILILIAEASIDPYEIAVHATRPPAIFRQPLALDSPKVSPTDIALVSSDFRTGVKNALRAKYTGQVWMHAEQLGPLQKIVQQKDLEWIIQKTTHLTLFEEEPVPSLAHPISLYLEVLSKNIIHTDLGLHSQDIDRTILSQCLLIHVDLCEVVDAMPMWKSPQISVVRVFPKDGVWGMETLIIQRRQYISEKDLYVAYSNKCFGWGMRAEVLDTKSRKSTV